VEYGLFSDFFMNKFACRKKMPIDIFLIFCHDILAMILFRILTKSKGVHVLVFLATEQKPCIFHDKPSHRQFRRQITLQCILIGKTSWSLSRRFPWIG
jgi:hypothetical protein